MPEVRAHPRKGTRGVRAHHRSDTSWWKFWSTDKAEKELIDKRKSDRRIARASRRQTRAYKRANRARAKADRAARRLAKDQERLEKAEAKYETFSKRLD